MSSPSTGTAGSSEGINRGDLVDMVDKATKKVKAKMDSLDGDSIQIKDMFEMQMEMNSLTQLSEMSSSIQSAMNSSISSMARNVKG